MTPHHPIIASVKVPYLAIAEQMRVTLHMHEDMEDLAQVRIADVLAWIIMPLIKLFTQ